MKFSLLLVLAACKKDADGVLDKLPPASLSTADEVAYWSSASAPNLLLNAYSPLFAIAAQEEQAEPCPQEAEADGVTTYTGGCTDQDGNAWEGVIETSAEGVTYDDLVLTQPNEDCDGETTSIRLNGVSLGDPEAEPLQFDLDLVLEVEGVDEDCEPSGGELAIRYAGTRVTQGAAETWSGTGRIGDTERGWVDATTTDELLDDTICDVQAVSGQTTLSNGSDVAVITYDGATDCDSDGVVPWSLNGEDMGTLSGVYCASVNPRSGLMGLALGLMLLGLRRR